MVFIHRDVTAKFDATIWLGDLNYRITGSREDVEAAVKAGNLEVRGPCPVDLLHFLHPSCGITRDTGLTAGITHAMHSSMT
jgi:hypothetical protein